MIHKLLEPYNVILATASKRRQDIFSMLNIPYSVLISDADEDIWDDSPGIMAEKIAEGKARHIAGRAKQRDLIITADTIVSTGDVILLKPTTGENARDMLGLLSNKTHLVYTGFCVSFKGQYYCDHEESLVEFAPLSEQEIEDYIATGEPMDKAGAYGIQGMGSQFIQNIEGCYFNIMGFPIAKFYKFIQKLHKEGHL